MPPCWFGPLLDHDDEVSSANCLHDTVDDRLTLEDHEVRTKWQRYRRKLTHQVFGSVRDAWLTGAASVAHAARALALVVQLDWELVQRQGSANHVVRRIEEPRDAQDRDLDVRLVALAEGLGAGAGLDVDGTGTGRAAAGKPVRRSVLVTVRGQEGGLLLLGGLVL